MHAVGFPGRILLKLLRGYKIALSPLSAGSCRFLPSCADYASEAVATHGAARGSWLAARRLARCHPFCAAGYDPVPAARSSSSMSTAAHRLGQTER